MQFPSKDLTNQYISTSYQDVIQIHYPTGSNYYILDGLGNVILSVPSQSFGNQILTLDQTASYAENSVTTSFYIFISSSFASKSISASWAPPIPSDYSISSSWASQSLSSSYANISLLSNVSDVALLSETSSLSEYSYFSLSSSWVSSSHVEKGIISGSSFSGSPLHYDIFFSKSFSNTIYMPSIIGEDARIWSIFNRTTNSISINSNSNQPLEGIVMWKVEE